LDRKLQTVQKQALETAQKQDPELFLNQDHQPIRLNSDWVVAMQEELHQFERNQVWHLVPKPRISIIIGTKWVFRNKLDEFRTVTQNKVRLVVQR